MHTCRRVCVRACEHQYVLLFLGMGFGRVSNSCSSRSLVLVLFDSSLQLLLLCLCLVPFPKHYQFLALFRGHVSLKQTLFAGNLSCVDRRLVLVMIHKYTKFKMLTLPFPKVGWGPKIKIAHIRLAMPFLLAFVISIRLVLAVVTCIPNLKILVSLV